ncbi:arabinogalactan protein 41-like [Malania oleifera]|uniref:arabinogalactan protein 41-like n=1 Tax=Malania oleifera TaxID=397392 RepID=UPI0025AE147A|nr:arabinogalactan protein 41-like [Malania oleifera]
MAVSRISLGVMAVISVLLFAIALPAAHAQAPAPPPNSDGTTIDQGIAYVLMLVALVLTYLIHTMDGSFSF